MKKETLFGICHLTQIPIRREAKHQAEMISQLVFGETYKVLSFSEDQKWRQIEMELDGYRGWINAPQFQPVSENYFADCQAEKHAKVFSKTALLEAQDKSIIIASAGSTLPFFKDAKTDVGFAAFRLISGEASSTPTTSLLETARNFLNAPYLWGGRSIFGLDCSGFVQQVFRMHGTPLWRDAYQQAAQGEEVSTIEDARAGDLAFFELPNGKVDHVGLVLPNRQIIHAFGNVRIDSLDEKGIKNADSGTYSHTLSFFRRIS